MESALLIIAMIVLYTLQSLLTKKYVDHYPGREEMASSVFTIISGAVVVVVSLCFTGFRFEAASETWLLGVLNAAVIIAYNYFIVKTAQTGPYTVLMVFSIAGGIILPTLVTFFAFGETMSVWKWATVVVVLCAVYMMSHRKSGEVAWTKVFIPCCIGLAISNGAYGTILNIQQQLTGEGEKEELISITYAIAAVVSFIIYLVKEQGSVRGFRQTRVSLIYLATCSLVVALAINVLVCIIPLVNVTVLYTFDNAGTLLLSVICSVVFFKERLSRLNIIGCAVMCAALVMITLV